MKLNNNNYLKNTLNTILQFLVLVLVMFVFMPFTTVKAAEFCSDEYYIDQIFPNGSRWDMCWEQKQREGIILNKVFFTPKNGQRRMVLNKAALAQIHVPYDDNGTRFHDVSDFGIGGDYILDLNPDECPAGSLLNSPVMLSDQTFVNKNVICLQVKNENIGFKKDADSESTYSLNLFNVSAVGAYYYIPKWVFKDDGTIEPWIGATGALQRYGDNADQGWVLGDGRIGVSHLHNFFWKLDFDIDGTHKNDAVEEINFELVNGKRQRRTISLTNESARSVNPETMRYWRVRDLSSKNENNRAISYDIMLNETGHQDIGPASEPFTHNDFYVTLQKNEERFASHNTTGAENLSEFVNGESLVDNDIVIWAGVTFYHMPRSEDAPYMDAHWSHFTITPRDWESKNVSSGSNDNSSGTGNGSESGGNSSESAGGGLFFYELLLLPFLFNRRKRSAFK